MKKIILAMAIVFALTGNAFGWDLYTYPVGKDITATGAPDMRAAVMYYFEAEAIIVQHNSATETGPRLEFSAYIIGGRANPNSLSRQVSTNPSIAVKIMGNDPTYVGDIAYVVSTSYSPSITTPLFTIVANALFPVDGS